MPGQGREIRRRIKSIKSTRQITKAMELVSAAKMRRAVANVLATRPYATTAWEVVQAIVQKIGVRQHPLLGGLAPDRAEGGSFGDEASSYNHEGVLTKGEEGVESQSQPSDAVTQKVALILITSNRGLAGSLNANVITLAQNYLAEQREIHKEAVAVVLGKKGRDALAKRGVTIVAEFDKPDVSEKVEEMRPIARLAMDEYLKGTYQKVVVAYTDFVSALVQKPRIRQLLPIVQDEFLGAVVQTSSSTASNKTAEHYEAATDGEDGYLFEPSSERVLDAVLPRLVEIQLLQAVLESDASEHSARMIAMRNATSAAGDMIDELTLLYNQTRQAGITQEIAEISAGRIAIER